MADENILFVTSFSPDLYEASGHKLIETYLRLHNRDQMVVYTEGKIALPSSPRLIEHSLDGDAFLTSWLKNNKDIIPEHLGGKAKPCRCPNHQQQHAKHKRGCYWSWWNRNASRWFRKVIAWRLSMQIPAMPHMGPFRYMVWLDADVYFLRALDHGYLATMLKKWTAFYFKGHRPAVESGILAFDLLKSATALVERVYQRYVTGAFRKDERWDDGYQLAKVFASSRDIKTHDLVHPTHYKGKTNHVIPSTSIAKYLVHEKGLHGRKLGIMR